MFLIAVTALLSSEGFLLACACASACAFSLSVMMEEVEVEMEAASKDAPGLESGAIVIGRCWGAWHRLVEVVVVAGVRASREDAAFKTKCPV